MTKIRRKDIIEKIKEVYSKSIVEIADEIDLPRGRIYFWLAQDGRIDNPVTNALQLKYPNAFYNCTNKKELKMKKEQFKVINKDIIGDTFKKPEQKEVANQQLQLPIEGVEQTEPTVKKNTIVLKNLRCPNECYFMKVPAQDYLRAKPKCPCCDSYMLTKEDRSSED